MQRLWCTEHGGYVGAVSCALCANRCAKRIISKEVEQYLLSKGYNRLITATKKEKAVKKGEIITIKDNKIANINGKIIPDLNASFFEVVRKYQLSIQFVRCSNNNPDKEGIAFSGGKKPPKNSQALLLAGDGSVQGVASWEKVSEHIDVDTAEVWAVFPVKPIITFVNIQQSSADNGNLPKKKPNSVRKKSKSKTTLP